MSLLRVLDCGPCATVTCHVIDLLPAVNLALLCVLIALVSQLLRGTRRRRGPA